MSSCSKEIGSDDVSPAKTAGDWLVHRIIVDVAELPDRTSPEDEPDMMLVEAKELRVILENHGVPDLLEALQGIVADDDASVSLVDQRARSDARMAAARAAISKATSANAGEK